MHKLSAIGNYQVRSRIGRGGMGEVYLASATGIEGVQRPVAIKLIRELHQQREAFVSMFIEEAKLSFLLTHPNIVQTYEIGQVDGHYFLVMEYVDGITLEELVTFVHDQLGQPLPVPHALYIASQTARGLDYAHTLADQHGHPLSIVHRDVSPSNVLLSRDGQVKLTDFGLAKSTLRRVHSEAGLIKGKLAYMAPEQLEGRTDVGPEADIYSLGVVLYEALAGQHPFGEGQEMTPLARHGMQVRPLGEVAPHLEPDVVALIERCMARPPEQRHRSARELSRALDSCLRRSGQAVSDYELAEFIERARSEASHDDTPAPHPFDLALGMELQKVEVEGGVSTFTRAAGAAAGPSRVDTDASSEQGVTLPPVPLRPVRGRPWVWLSAVVLGMLGLGLLGWLVLQPDQRGSSKPRDRDAARGTAARVPDARGGDIVAAATASAPATGALHVRPAPAGGRVTVAGRGRGTAPLSLEGLPAAEPIRVRIDLPGHLPYDQLVTLEPGGSLTLQPRLRRRPSSKPARRRRGYLSVNSDPWSNVYVDGRKIRSTPLIRHPLSAGPHRVRLYNPARKLGTTRTVRIHPERETRLSVELR